MNIISRIIKTLVHPLCICYINCNSFMALKTRLETKNSFHRQFNVLYELNRSKTRFDEKQKLALRTNFSRLLASIKVKGYFLYPYSDSA